MTRNESSSFLHFKNLEVTGNTFELLSSVDQKTSRTGGLMQERTQLKKESHDKTSLFVIWRNSVEGLLHWDDARENGLSCSVCPFLYIVICMKLTLIGSHVLFLEFLPNPSSKWLTRRNTHSFKGTGSRLSACSLIKLLFPIYY